MEALEEEERQETVKPLVPEYGDVLDLLKNLPDAVPSPTQTTAAARQKCAASQEKTPVLVRTSRSNSLAGEMKEQQQQHQHQHQHQQQQQEVVVVEDGGRLPLGSRCRRDSLEYSTVC